MTNKNVDDAAAPKGSDSSKLCEGLDAFRVQSRERAAHIDLSASIMAEIGTREGQKTAPSNRWRWLFPAAATAAICALLFAWFRREQPSRFYLDAPAGVLLVQGSEIEPVRGHDVPLSVPFALKTGARQHATVRHVDAQSPYTIHIWPNSDLQWHPDHYHQNTSDTPEGYRLVAGGVRVTAPAATSPSQANRPHHLVAGAFQLDLQGDVSVELAAKDTDMKILKKHKVAATGALLAIAVYGGWSKYSSQDSQARIQSPGGLYVDQDGKAHRFALTDDEAGGGGLVREGGEPGSQWPGAADRFNTEHGAFWNPETKVIDFRLQGEALNSDTGEAVENFSITAVPIESKDFAQAKPRSWSFADRNDGHFEIGGLGRGIWQVTGRSSRFAPVSQVLDLSDLEADPYLVIPFSEGAQLSGQVVDWRQRPVSGARVGLMECMAEDAAETCEVALSDSSGRFVLSRLPDDEVFAIAAQHAKYGVASARGLRGEVGASQHLIIPLSGRIRIFGEVSRGKEKRPFAAATVVSSDVHTETDANGVYELFAPLTDRPEAFVESEPGGPRARARVTSHPQGRSAQVVRWVDADTHVAELRIDFRLAMEKGILFGQVRDSDGSAMAGVELRLANSAGWAGGRDHETFPTSTITNGTGHYRIENVPVQAGYRFDYRVGPDENWQHLGYVNVMAEEEVEANFQIGSGAIRGRFVDAESGEALPVSERGCTYLGATRSGKSSGKGAGYFYLPHCYVDGRFEFTGLPAGSYELKHRLEWMDSPIEISPVTVSLSPGKITDGVQVKAKGEGADTWRFRILNARGQFLSGTYLRYHDGNTAFTTNLEVDAGGSAAASINRRYRQVFIDCAGYNSRELSLSELDSDQVVEVRLERQPKQDEAEVTND